MFGTNLDVEISCLDPQCEGTLVAQFKGRGESEIVTSSCSECQHKFDVNRVDWSDTPNDEVGWKVIPHNE